MKGFVCAYKCNARPDIRVFQLAVCNVCSEVYCGTETKFLLSHFIRIHNFRSLRSLCSDYPFRPSLTVPVVSPGLPTDLSRLVSRCRSVIAIK